MKVLVVEDSPTILMTMKVMLTSMGFEVDTAESAEDAMALLQADPVAVYDLIITDLHMPGDNGITLIRKVKALPGFEGVPILILTAETEKHERASARQAGAAGWLVKPVPHARLLDVIRIVLPTFPG
ncbi:response regulator [Mariprofundus erugo]|uniref:Response regulator n=1 Tax=Mariprofundus erugo TaxID=2528639 RepID=A0A5R9GYJ3_9PROT|nr:response regulator [Mariprofundus erugo]TLS68014.1 response regulator [Mariprofundus erugo]TLS76739.1 response regulator [Mariprofundus erugo]